MAATYKTVASNGGKRLAHRVIAEKALGRPLLPGEVVHHIDHNPRNNDPANLKVMTHLEHSQLHLNKHARIKVCVICGSDFEPAPTRRRQAKTCSRQCLGVLLSQINRARGSTRRVRYPLICKHCGQEFFVRGYYRDKAQFCGHPCANAAKRLPRA